MTAAAATVPWPHRGSSVTGLCHDIPKRSPPPTSNPPGERGTTNAVAGFPSSAAIFCWWKETDLLRNRVNRTAIQSVSSVREPRLGWLGFGCSTNLPSLTAASVKFPSVEPNQVVHSKSNQPQPKCTSRWDTLYTSHVNFQLVNMVHDPWTLMCRSTLRVDEISLLRTHTPAGLPAWKLNMLSWLSLWNNEFSYTLTESVACKSVDDKDTNFLGRHTFSFNCLSGDLFGNPFVMFRNISGGKGRLLDTYAQSGSWV